MGKRGGIDALYPRTAAKYERDYLQAYALQSGDTKISYSLEVVDIDDNSEEAEKVRELEKAYENMDTSETAVISRVAFQVEVHEHNLRSMSRDPGDCLGDYLLRHLEPPQ